MRKLMLWGALAIMLALIPSCGHAQGQGSGILYASDFNAWSLPQGTAPAAGMIQWPTAAICQVSSNGYSFTAIKVGRPLTVVDVVPSQTETVIPTAVTTSGGSCTVTAPMTHLHLSYSVRSGTSGLQEAIDYSAKIVGGSLVILTPGWTTAGGVSSMVTSAYGQSATSILDERVATLCQYAWNGSAYVAAGCSADAASLSALTLQTFAGPLAVPQGITAPITGHASLDLPLTGGALSGPLVAPQINASYTPAPGSALQSIITTAGANSDIALSCGTYTVAVGGLTIPSANVHLHGVSRDCTFVSFSGPAGLSVSGANVQIDGITFEGPTNNYTVQAETTAHGFNFHDNRITGAGSALGASQNSGALVIVAPNQDIWVVNDEFTGDGVSGNTGYIVKTDGGAAGYVQRLHFLHNWIHDNISPDPLYAFDIANSELNDNVIDQGNICGGVLCNNPAGNGVGYALQVYSQGYSLTVNSLTRVSGVVTAVLPVAFSTTWPLNVGDQIMEETALAGTNGTDFNGVFTVASISGDRKTITWNQTGIPNDTGAGLGPPYANGVLIPPLQNVTVARNKISNSAGACTYFQGLSNLVVADNTLTQCDLQSQAGGHPQSAIGLAGVWGGSITGNGIDGVGLTHGIAAQNAYFVTIASNSIGNIPLGMGINIFDSSHLSVNSNTIHDAVTGIGTSTGTAPNCFICSLEGNTIRMMANSSGYGFGAADSQISVTGGSIHAPSTGASNSAVALGALTSHITVTGVTINCQPDFATAATATITYGIRSLTGSSLNTMRGNTITGCNASSGAGINDQGNDDSISSNSITGGLFGILANGGNRQLIVGNPVWGNTTAINTSGSTGAVLLGNQTTQGATPVYFTFDFTQSSYTFGADANSTDLMNLTGAAGHQRLFGWLTSGVARWSCGADSAAESGSNAGSPFVCRAYDDSGTVIDAWLSVVRASGGAETHTRPVVLPSLKVTGAAGASTFCLQIDNTGNVSNTGAGCGGGGGGGSVTAFAAPAGSWPAWLVPTVTNSTTTPSLAVATANVRADLFAVKAGVFYTNAEFSNGTCTTALTVDPVNGNRQKVTLTNADTCALTFTQPASGTATVQLKVTQSAVSTFNGGISGCKWPGGVVPTITQTTGAVDMVSAYLDGTTAYCQIAQAFQ